VPQPDAIQAAPYASLDDLLAAHAELLKSMPEGRLCDTDVGRIREFLRRAAASGALIDIAADRKQVQGLLDYWSATLYSITPSSSGEPPAASRLPKHETVLAEFEATTIADVASKVERWLRSLTPADRDLVRRILMRLVRLSDVDRTFQPAPATRADLQQLGTPARTDALLDGLRDAGVVRIEKGDSPEAERVTLRFAALTRKWPEYAGWLDRRLRFRDTVSFWRSSNRDPSTLIRDELLDEALDYYGKNDLEQAFITASRERERTQNSSDRVAKYVFAGVAVVAVIFAALAISQWTRARRAAAAERSYATEAVKQEALAKSAEAAMAAKFKLSNMVTVTRTLAQIGTGGEAERLIAVRRMKFLAEGLRQDPDFAPVFAQIARDLDSVEKGTASKDDLEAIAFKALEVGRALKDRVLAVHDTALERELKAERSVAFGMAQFCAEQIVETFDKQSYEAAASYIDEFWVHYWGELGLLEGPAVESAMVEFGAKLREIQGKIKSQLPDAVKLVAPHDLNWSSTRQLREKLFSLRSNKGMTADVDRVLGELSVKAVSKQDVKELRSILKTKLSPALASELKGEIPPSEAVPKAY
jgi:hypothetical protein